MCLHLVAFGRGEGMTREEIRRYEQVEDLTANSEQPENLLPRPNLPGQETMWANGKWEVIC